MSMSCWPFKKLPGSSSSRRNGLTPPHQRRMRRTTLLLYSFKGEILRRTLVTFGHSKLDTFSCDCIQRSRLASWRCHTVKLGRQIWRMLQRSCRFLHILSKPQMAALWVWMPMAKSATRSAKRTFRCRSWAWSTRCGDAVLVISIQYVILPGHRSSSSTGRSQSGTGLIHALWHSFCFSCCVQGRCPASFRWWCCARDWSSDSSRVEGCRKRGVGKARPQTAFLLNRVAPEAVYRHLLPAPQGQKRQRLAVLKFGLQIWKFPFKQRHFAVCNNNV